MPFTGFYNTPRPLNLSSLLVTEVNSKEIYREYLKCIISIFEPSNFLFFSKFHLELNFISSFAHIMYLIANYLLFQKTALF